MFRSVLFCLWILSFWGQVVLSSGQQNDALRSLSKDLDEWQPRNARPIRNVNEQLNCVRPSVYTCEVPPNAVPPEVRNTCKYRDVVYQEQVYRWVAGRGCIFYTSNFLFEAGYNPINLSGSCVYGDLFAPCVEIAKEDGTCGCFPYDPEFDEVVSLVNEAMIPSVRGRWERCFYSAEQCCKDYMAEVTNDNADECETTFDGWTCWHAAGAGTVASEVCSEFAYSNVGPACHHYSYKDCFQDGTWNATTDYVTCSITPRLLRRYRFHIAMLAFSVTSCLPAIFIFYFYKRLRITRVALHRNLLIAIVVRNILVIISRSEIYIDSITTAGDTVLSTHGVGCKILAIAERIASNAVFVCMLIEGIYLHRLIVAVFKKKLNINWLYGIGAVITVTPVVAWAVVMSVYDDHSCWVIYTVENIQWTLDAPRIAILIINTILFVDVLRVLMTKIRNAENSNQLSTTKTTLFLMPLFGTQFLLTAFRPNTTDCMAEQSYYYVAYTLEGLQGFIVAMLYCYVNKEVRMLLKATYRKTESAVISRVRSDSAYPRMSVDPRSDRRLTYSTAVHSQNDNEPKDPDNTTITPKLHVAEIISIQASERLADILEPVYETIEGGAINKGYDSLERSSVNDTRLATRRDQKPDNDNTYYGFTNVSSVSMDCRDWIKGISSPSSSIYNNSLNYYEPKYSEINHESPEKSNEVVDIKSLSDGDNTNISDANTDRSIANKSETTVDDLQDCEELTGPEQETNENMLNEIMQYIETNDHDSVNLNADALAPNRQDGDKIIFIDDSLNKL